MFKLNLNTSDEIFDYSYKRGKLPVSHLNNFDQEEKEKYEKALSLCSEVQKSVLWIDNKSYDNLGNTNEKRFSLHMDRDKAKKLGIDASEFWNIYKNI